MGKNGAWEVGTEWEPSSERIGDLLDTGRETGSTSGLFGEGEFRRFTGSTTGTGRAGATRSDSTGAGATGFCDGDPEA